MKLGQSATTLSGGEAQRVKLSRELSKRPTGRTMYILDEPTTGLHFADIQRLLDVLDRLVETGNTVLVIEHNLDVIKNADWIIDLGPEGGDRGGEIVAEGPPKEIAKVEAVVYGTSAERSGGVAGWLAVLRARATRGVLRRPSLDARSEGRFSQSALRL